MHVRISLIGAALVLSVPVWSQAIYTTTSTGTTVNGNIYAGKEDVYLSGGPQSNCGGNGLPVGALYFQVTDPSGSVLLTTDELTNRTVTAGGGVMSAYAGTRSWSGGFPCGSIGVRVFPFEDTPNNGGEYKLLVTSCPEVDGSGFLIAGQGCFSRTDNFKVRASVVCPDGCGAGGPPEITGYKWYDADTDGVVDVGEVRIAGWKVVSSAPSTGYTDAPNGDYYFLGQPNTSYTITEHFANSGWLATTPASGAVTTGTTGTSQGPNFGNVCVGGGGGMTLGFWSNKNGKGIMDGNAGVYVFLSGLNLRNGAGGEFNAADYAGFRIWILGASATNMAYMLSAQMAAMQLNVREGKVGAASLIYAPGAGSANGSGFASVEAVLGEANAELGLHGVTASGSLYRAYQEALKNALDGANNNVSFVQAGPCGFVTPY